MMINSVIILIIVALAAWLGNVMMSVEQAVALARSRVRSARDTVAKLESTIKRLQRDEEALNKESEDLNLEIGVVRHKHAEAMALLTEAQGKRKPSLLVLTDRKGTSDKDWLVVIANTQLREIDANHPLGGDWARGREYLVWAESERDAGERALRRFNTRPGFSLRSVSPAREEIFPQPKPAGAPGRS